MNRILLTIYRFVAWVLSYWIRVRTYPKNISDFNIPEGSEIIYVTKDNSLSDIGVIERQSKKLGITPILGKSPKLSFLGFKRHIFLSKLGLVAPKRRQSPPAKIYDLLSNASKDPSTNIVLLPVSIVWGSDHKKSNGSFFRSIYTDDEHAGFLQKFFIILAQGKEVFCSFGKPIILNEQLNESTNIHELAKRIRRVLRVHFYRERQSVIGPNWQPRESVIKKIIQSEAVQAAITEESSRKKQSSEKTTKQANKIVREILADQKHSVVKWFSALLTRVWGRMFSDIEVRGEDKLRDIAASHRLVYIPCHRSHVDYLVFKYLIHKIGLRVPHTAAGLNLNFWPMGTIFRNSGAFFIRRKFRGNRLYMAIFNEYIHFLVKTEHSVLFFTEGGRSRTGKILQPKTGMLSMVTHSYLRDDHKPLAMVPVFINYDKLLEIRSYQKELQGAQKKKESLAELFKLGGVFKNKYGYISVNFGESIKLDQNLDQYLKDKNETLDSKIKYNHKPEWFAKFNAQLAQKIHIGINKSAHIGNNALCALSLLSTKQKALDENEMQQFIKVLKSMLQTYKHNQNWTTTDLNPAQVIKLAEETKFMNRLQSTDGDVMYLDAQQTTLALYSRNNLTHVIGAHSITAYYLVQTFFKGPVSIEELKKDCENIYSFFCKDHFIDMTNNAHLGVFENIIEQFHEHKIVKYKDSKIELLDSPLERNSHINLIANLARHSFQRYAFVVSLLSKIPTDKQISRTEFLAYSKNALEKLRVLSGLNHEGNLNNKALVSFFDALKDDNFLTSTENGFFQKNDNFKSIEESCMIFLSNDLKNEVTNQHFQQAKNEDNHGV